MSNQEHYPLVAKAIIECLEKLCAMGTLLTLVTICGVIIATILNMALDIFEKKRKDSSIF